MSARDTDELRKQFSDNYESVRKQFREDHEFAIGPLRDKARSEYDGALKFADGGIRSLFSLNGGGLIALPAFVKLFETDMHGATAWFVGAAILMFVAGLIAAALVSLLGYFSAMKGNESAQLNMTAISTKYATHYGQIPETSTTEAGIKAAESTAKKHTARSILLRTIAVTSSVVSLVAFITGACLAAWALVPLT
jgi:hypothetical protein